MMKHRADVALVEAGFAKSRAKAQAMIESGLVTYGGQVVTKPAMKVELTGLDVLPVKQYVGNGATKLLRAIDYFNIDCVGKVAMDIGASTGGFTQVLLEHGVASVYAIDVGSDQLHPDLIEDPRVLNLEKTNFRTLESIRLDEKADLVTIDVSFISAKHILDNLPAFLAEHFEILLLVKPQFEVGKTHVGKGIITDPKHHVKVLTEMFEFMNNKGFTVEGLTFSPVKGGKGNIEYLLYATNANKSEGRIDCVAVVREAFQQLNPNVRR